MLRSRQERTKVSPSDTPLERSGTGHEEVSFDAGPATPATVIGKSEPMTPFGLVSPSIGGGPFMILSMFDTTTGRLPLLGWRAPFHPENCAGQSGDGRVDLASDLRVHRQLEGFARQ